jgi:predicted acylesterase/phospholipase RssA
MSTRIAGGSLKKCDIVMKGGITSGIVYPGLICKLAERYQFQSIGGTSAGAIAAALLAAAEYARRQGRDTFRDIGAVPGWLGAPCKFAQGSNLLNLFQPQRELRVLFRLATAFLVEGWLRRALQCAEALWLEILLGLVPAVLFFLLVPTPLHWSGRVPGILLLLFLILSGVVFACAAGVLVRTRRLPSRHYGLCTGYAAEDKSRPPSLVAWLNERLNTMAGLPANHPLTFGDLKAAGITLRMLSTCLTFGRPYTLPFTSGEFFYSSAELRQFFPNDVVAWMDAHSPTFGDHGEKIDTAGLQLLPNDEHLPVIVATRLSLSFPFLFCAVPLYAVDWTRRRKSPNEPASERRVPGDALDPDELRKPERVWFSDGGICSNFPLHLFDSPLPKWPTFGINLADLRPDRDTRVWTPESNRAGVAHLWSRMGTDAGIAQTAQLFSSMFNAARNWVDNLQSMVPGYRDRLVHVFLDQHEGGLNLNMARDVVDALSGYGTLAGRKLIDRFLEGTDDDGKPTAMTWDNHRWIRYRSTMALLETFLSDFAYSVEHPEPGDRNFFELISRESGVPPASYPLNEKQRGEAADATRSFVAAGQRDQSLAAGAPKPTPALRIRPSF